MNLANFGQLIIYSSADTTDHFFIDKIRESGDSSFVTVRHYIQNKLIHKEDQINIRYKAESTTTISDKGSDLYVLKTLSHGKSTEWYPSGQIKSHGTFTFNKKNNDWTYWNSDGKQISVPDEGADIKIRGNYTDFIDGVKTPKQK